MMQSPEILLAASSSLNRMVTSAGPVDSSSPTASDVKAEADVREAESYSCSETDADVSSKTFRPYTLWKKT